MTLARMTVSDGISCASGVNEPTPLMCVPGLRSESAKTGFEDVVAAQMMSASSMACDDEHAGKIASGIG